MPERFAGPPETAVERDARTNDAKNYPGETGHVFAERTTSIIGRAKNCEPKVPNDMEHRWISRHLRPCSSRDANSGLTAETGLASKA
jgi:hypothetical protein